MFTKISITEALQKEAIFIDTRTPKEYQEDHLPKALNIPMFLNDQRAVIGKIYKQISQDKAIQKGIELFSKRLPEFMKEINQYKDKQLIIYCWRGGMRSKTVVSLLDSLGYNVLQLDGGHKEYRRHIVRRLQTAQVKPKLIVLWGLTCSGKTKLITQFKNSIDLEGLAQHRGSLYGGIGLTPNTQKRFESLLFERLDQLQNEEYIFVEGESKRIGQVVVPEFFHKKMRNGTHILVKKSLDQRAELAMKEYFTSPDDIQKIKEITMRLKKVISNENKEKVISLLDNRKFSEAAKILLEFYYDPLYNHTLKNINFSFEIVNDPKAIEKLANLFC